MNFTKNITLALGTVVVLAGLFSFSDTSGKNYVFDELFSPQDSSSKNNPPDSNKTVGNDRYGNPISNPGSSSPLDYQTPSNIKLEVQPSRDLRNYTITETIGDSLEYRPTSEMSFQEFAEYQRKQYIRDYWKSTAKTAKQQEREEQGLIPPITNSRGEPVVDIRPSGNVTLEFGGRWSRTENPAIPVRLQRNGGFEFDQQIGLNLQGKIGDRLNVAANWNTQATFDFNNNIKVSYEGKEEDIIRDIQVGNVSMPINNSLIRGAQNLFGVKTQLQFGRLGVTTIFSRQRGTTETLIIKGGAQNRPINLFAADYDNYRHFFLSHYFKKVFDDAYERNPLNPNSGVRITRVEVWKTNTGNQTQDLRNILALTDLGENGEQREPTFEIINSATNEVNITDNSGFIANDDIVGTGVLNPSNNSNNLLTSFFDSTQNNLFRDVSQTRAYANDVANLQSGFDYEIVNSAVKLELGRDYTFHPELGFISLTSPIDDEHALAVAFEYTLNGVPYQVGELNEDYSNTNGDEVILLKLLKPQSIQTNEPIWDLMMKNIYALNTNNIQRENFQLRVIYNDDITGIDNPSLQEGGSLIKDVPLIQLLDVDRFNLNRDLIPDGNFDFLENTTVMVDRGRIIFPKVEPFGRDLENLFELLSPNQADFLTNKYVFETLYSNTKNAAQRNTQKNKFVLKGSYQSASSTDIILPGINVAEGSVSITVGSNRLQEGRDFTVNYGINRVSITNEGVLASGNDIKITYEKTDLFGFRNKSLVGTRLDYTINEDINIGGTLLHLSEQPFVTRINVGDETIKNTQVGADLKYKDESRILTKMVDFLPVISTKAASNVAVDLEVAALLPGNSRVLGDNGTSYIDDFEGAETPFDFSRSPQTWRISSTPLNLPTNDAMRNDLGYTSHRAKLAWYNIDNTFFSDNAATGFTIPEEQQGQEANHYVRAIIPQEIFPNQDPQQITLNTNTLDLAYYPKLRGPYNYSTDADATGKLLNPKQNWGGISRAITFDTDFDAGNVEYIEFWLMNPFQTTGGEPILNEVLPTQVEPASINSMGGDLYFNLGDISEDVTKDGRQGFENGLPDNVEETQWGKVTTETYVTNAFSNQIDRSTQDVGYDGIGNGEEVTFFDSVITELQSKGINEPNFLADPSTDNFQHYSTEDDDPVGIVERYFDFNGMENNSPINDGSTSFPKANYNTPDNEDLNNDRTINFNDNYFQYKLDLDPVMLADGSFGLDIANNPFIVDEQVATVDNNPYGAVRWYQVRIPIKSGYEGVGNVTQESFQTIRFMRMYLTDFEDPILLRMAQLQLVSSQWRRVDVREGNQNPNLNEGILPPNSTESTDGGEVVISTVNIEENGTGAEGRSPYVIAPGIVRDFDGTQQVQRQQNEQSLQIEVADLEDDFAAGVFRNVTTDLINYGRINMFIHAETDDINTNNGDIYGFIRLGTDVDQNYYEIRVPLTFSNTESDDPNEVWREENRVDVPLDELINTKLERDRVFEEDPANGFQRVYTRNYNNYVLAVKGNPDRSTIISYVLGARNIADDIDGRGTGEKNFRLWFNELRVTDFDKRAGWAGTGSVSAQLADLGNLNVSGAYRSIGYGDIESKISQRERANTAQYGIATNLAIDKFIPKKIINLPLYLAYDKTIITPQFDPLNPDVETKESINNIENDDRRETRENTVVFKRTVRTAQLTSVKLVKTKQDAKKHFYDPHNITLSAGVTEEKQTGLGGSDKSRGNNVAIFLNQTYKGSAAYNYSFKPATVEPFKKVKFLDKKSLQLIKDININFLPSSVAVRGDLNRSYIKTQLYNDQFTTQGVTPTYEKRFTFDRNYNLRWNLTKSINLNYTATANALVDDPLGDKNGNPEITRPGFTNSREEYRDSLYENLFDFGRLKRYSQDISATYQIPINKLPLLDWINTDVKYSAGYTWTAAPIGLERLGNYINNNNDFTVNGKLNMVKLYQKVPFLKALESSSRKRKRIQPRSNKPKKEEENEEDDEEKKPRKPLKGLNGLARGLLMVRNINGRFSLRNTTTVPGFNPIPRYLGANDEQNWAPGFPFILGSQDLEGFKETAVLNEWITTDSTLNQPFAQTTNREITVNATIEPVKAFRINLSAKYSKGVNYTETFRFVPDSGAFVKLNPFLSGNLSMSYITIRTAFIGDNDDNSHPTFTKFSNYRTIYTERLNRGLTDKAFEQNSQQVLVPAFIAAYTGREVSSADELSEQDIKPAPAFPLPNWNINYSGLSRLKPFKKKFSSINLTHAYTSQFAIGNFSSSLLYSNITSATVFETNGLLLQEDETNGSLVPNLIIGDVVMTERFSPLVGITIRTRSNVNFRVNYNKSRSLALNLSNSQVVERGENNVQFGIGYSKRGFSFKLPFMPEKVTLPNNITFKADVTVGDIKTTQRSLSSSTQEENNVVTDGALSIQIRPNINYEYNRRLNIQLFFERTINEPKVSSSFRRTSTAFGVRLRFSLT